MRYSEMPIDKAGINKSDFNLITKEIDEHLRFQPSKPLSVQNISASSKVHPNIVKKVFYLLLSYRSLKATFIPRHNKCRGVIGEQCDSAMKINDLVEEGIINWCNYCQEPIEEIDDIDISIIFWKPGLHV